MLANDDLQGMSYVDCLECLNSLTWERADVPGDTDEDGADDSSAASIDAREHSEDEASFLAISEPECSDSASDDEVVPFRQGSREGGSRGPVARRG